MATAWFAAAVTARTYRRGRRSAPPARASRARRGAELGPSSGRRARRVRDTQFLNRNGAPGGRTALRPDRRTAPPSASIPTPDAPRHGALRGPALMHTAPSTSPSRPCFSSSPPVARDPDAPGRSPSRARARRGPVTAPARGDGGPDSGTGTPASTPGTSSPTPSERARRGIFPPDSYWNTRIDDAPVDPRSDAYIAAMGADDPLVASWDAEGDGLPYVEVGKTSRRWRCTSGASRRERPRPLPHPVGCADGPQHRPPRPGRGPRQRLALRAVRRLTERPTAPGTRPTARSGTCARNDGRPERWTSADAAGMPIFPGLVR